MPMKEAVVIRSAEERDWPQVYRLLNELEATPLPEAECRGVYLSNLLRPDIFYFTAEMGRDVVGFSSLHVQALLHHASRIGELQELIVSAAYRGAGVGRALFQKALETAVWEGCAQLEVCCNRTREKSHEFYRRQGMEDSHFKFCLKL